MQYPAKGKLPSLCTCRARRLYALARTLAAADLRALAREYDALADAAREQVHVTLSGPPRASHCEAPLADHLEARREARFEWHELRAQRIYELPACLRQYAERIYGPVLTTVETAYVERDAETGFVYAATFVPMWNRPEAARAAVRSFRITLAQWRDARREPVRASGTRTAQAPKHDYAELAAALGL